MAERNQNPDQEVERCRALVVEMKAKRQLAVLSRACGVPRPTLQAFAEGRISVPGYTRLKAIRDGLAQCGVA